MNKQYLFWSRVVAAIFTCIALGNFAHADNPRDGTWQLSMRKLPDGTTLKPPIVQGRSSFHNGVNQLVVFWPTPDGKSASLSSISKWEWTDSEVSATRILLIFDDGSGNPPAYMVGGETKREPIGRHDGRVSYQHPLDPPLLVYDGNKMTATLQGVFVDYWEKVE